MTRTGSDSDDAPTTSAGEASVSDGGTTGIEATTNGSTSTDAQSTSGETTTGNPPDTTTGETAATADTTDTTDTTDTNGTGNTTDDTTTGGDPDCQAPGTQPPCDAGTNDVFKALGLNCSDDPSSAIQIKNPVIMAPDARPLTGSRRITVPPRIRWSPRCTPGARRRASACSSSAPGPSRRCRPTAV